MNKGEVPSLHFTLSSEVHPCSSREEMMNVDNAALHPFNQGDVRPKKTTRPLRCLSGSFGIVKLHLGHNHNNKQILLSLPKPNCSEKKLLNVHDTKLCLRQKWLMLLAKHKPLKSCRVWKITGTTQPFCTVCLYQNTTTTTRCFQVQLPNCGVEACSSSKLSKHPFLFDLNQTILKKN